VLESDALATSISKYFKLYRHDVMWAMDGHGWPWMAMDGHGDMAYLSASHLLQELLGEISPWQLAGSILFCLLANCC